VANLLGNCVFLVSRLRLLISSWLCLRLTAVSGASLGQPSHAAHAATPAVRPRLSFHTLVLAGIVHFGALSNKIGSIEGEAARHYAQQGLYSWQCSDRVGGASPVGRGIQGANGPKGGAAAKDRALHQAEDGGRCGRPHIEDRQADAAIDLRRPAEEMPTQGGRRAGAGT